MEIPATLQVGDTWSWEDELDDYSADDGWTLTYYFQNEAASFSIAASGDGTTHTTSALASASAGRDHGRYKWTARVANDDSAPTVYSIGSGYVDLLPDLSESRDTRTWARRAYDELTAIIEGRASKAASALSYNGRSVQYMTWPEIQQAHAFLKQQVEVEEQGSTLGVGNQIRVRYGRV